MSTARATGTDSIFITIVGIVMIFGYYYTDFGYDQIDAYFYGEAGHILFGILCALVAYAKNRNPVIWFAWGMWFVLASLIVLAFFKRLSDVECPFCRKGIDNRATICPYCRKDLEGGKFLDDLPESEQSTKKLSVDRKDFILILIVTMAVFAVVNIWFK